MVQNRIWKVKLRTIDTDVIVLALGLFDKYRHWTEIGIGKDIQLDVSSMHETIETKKVKAKQLFDGL